MGVDRGRRGGHGPPEFSYMISLMCFSTSTRIVKTTQLSPTILVLCYACWQRKGWLKKTGDQKTKFFCTKMVWKFSKKVGIFQNTSVSPKKVLHVLHGALGAAFHWVESWMYAQCAPQPATDKEDGCLLVLILGLGFSIDPPSGIFSADAVGSRRLNKIMV